MTMHRAKGMEFAKVILVGAGAKTSPARTSSMRFLRGTGLTRCVGTVAAVRGGDAARDELVVVYAGEPSELLPSNVPHRQNSQRGRTLRWRTTAGSSGGVTRSADDELEWLAVTRPGARSVIDRQKVWTLVPVLSMFVANWFVTEDHRREDDECTWVFENIDIYEARAVALKAPDPSASDMSRLTRPESCLTLNQINRYPADRLLGTRWPGS
ncbi:hypothetical protein GTA09_19905 [Rhodococcus hoagii]|nr:hypothetical protein [Prescottella equi]